MLITEGQRSLLKVTNWLLSSMSLSLKMIAGKSSEGVFWTLQQMLMHKSESRFTAVLQIISCWLCIHKAITAVSHIYEMIMID